MFFSIIISFHLHPSVVWTPVNERREPNSPSFSLSTTPNHYFNPNFSTSVTAFRSVCLFWSLTSYLILSLCSFLSKTAWKRSTSIEFVQYVNVHPFAWSSGNCWLPVSDCLFWQMRPKARAANCVHRVCGTRQRKKKKKNRNPKQQKCKKGVGGQQYI